MYINAKIECNDYHKKSILIFQQVSFDFVMSYCAQNEESYYKICCLL